MVELRLYIEDALQRLSSSDNSFVHDGLRRLHALLEKLCLLSSLPEPVSKPVVDAFEISTISSNIEKLSTKEISLPNSLSNSNKKWRVPNNNDSVFGEFLQLQDGFQTNIVSNSIVLLHRMSQSNDFPIKDVVLNLSVMQGCLLIHPDSRNIFNRKSNMEVFLNCLQPNCSPEIIVSVIPTLVSCLVRNVPNLRAFEELGGTEIVCNLLKHKPINNNHNNNKNIQNWKEVQVKVLEFLFFYLIPETKTTKNSKPNETATDKNTKTSIKSLENSIKLDDNYSRRTTEEKVEILNQYLNKNVTDGLVNELFESRPFGNMNIEW